MGQLSAFCDLVDEIAPGSATFALIYLEEAHPIDGWMYPGTCAAHSLLLTSTFYCINFTSAHCPSPHPP